MPGLASRLAAWETALARREWGAKKGVGDLLAEDFREFGASGRVYDRAQALAALQGPPGPEVDLEGLEVRLLGPDVALVTYRARLGTEPPARSLRSSLWQRQGDRWRMVFHQGTPMPPSGVGRP